MNDVMRLVPRAQALTEEAIAALEELLTAAKNGDFCAVAFVAIRPDGAPASLVATEERHAYALVGALEAAKLDVLLDSE